MRVLKKLRPQARSQVTLETYAQSGISMLESYVGLADREIDISHLTNLIGKGMDRYDSEGQSPVGSDGWLAPRVHASLRLYRREAGNLQYWEYLSICVPEVREYIMWRWPGKDGQLPTKNRIYGSDRRHALGRLWWTAELTRNGDDYSPTVAAFRAGSQDLINYITDTLAFNNRAAAIGFVRYFNSKRDDDSWGAKNAVDLAKALNHVLTTIVLDGLVPDPGGNMDAYSKWVEEFVDETLMFDQLPAGPDEPKVPEEKIEAVEALLDSLQVQLRSKALEDG